MDGGYQNSGRFSLSGNDESNSQINYNIENKENINPLNARRQTMRRSNFFNNNIQNENMKMDEKLEDKYKLLKKKKLRKGDEDEDKEKEKTFKKRIESNNLIQNAKMIFSETCERSKYSFKVDNIPIKFGMRNLLRSRKEKKIILTLVKSNVNLSMINKNFIITERGIDCSQKTHSTHYVSVGRQQVNEQGIRPNDIMLFPTDPSVSRSHFKILFKDFFDQIKEFDEKLIIMRKLNHPKLCRSNTFNQINSENVFNLMKFIHPKFQVGIEDNGTIYGTYVRVQPFTIESFLNTFVIIIKNMIRKSENSFVSNFSFVETLEIFNQSDMISNQFDNKNNKRKEFLKYVYKNRVSIGETFNQTYDNNSELDQKRLLNFQNNLSNSDKTDKEILSDNNFIINKFLPAVFLNSSRSGFNIIKIGDLSQVLEAIKLEYLAFLGNEYLNHFIEIISIDKVLECQKMDLASQMYKVTISKNELFYLSHNHNINSIFSDYSILYLIETEGDPCGVMSRKTEALFLANKKGEFCNMRSFSFNFIKGFILGSNCKSCLHLNSEVWSFIFYNILLDKWILTDLTKFLNPQIFYSQEYYGLWMCISPDKLLNSRYTPRVYFIKDEDEIRVSETVMKVNIVD